MADTIKTISEKALLEAYRVNKPENEDQIKKMAATFGDSMAALEDAIIDAIVSKVRDSSGGALSR
jgi:hypothetical protein